MAPPSEFIITISNKTDLAVLGVIRSSDEFEGDFADDFKHLFRSMFNAPAFVKLAVDFAVQTVELESGEEVPTDPAELVALADARQS